MSIPQKINKAEEAEKLRELLRDDFIDDGTDVDIENAPIALPMLSECWYPKLKDFVFSSIEVKFNFKTNF